MVSASIKRIELLFDSCDYIRIDRRHLGALSIGGIERTVQRTACNAIDDITWANKVCIEVNTAANTTQPGALWDKEQLAFARVTAYKDITRIYVVYEDDKEECFSIPYDTGTDELLPGANNLNQASKLNQFGDLYLVIGKGLDIDEEFPDHEINDKEKREGRWNLWE